jgi:hypothetical protein
MIHLQILSIRLGGEAEADILIGQSISTKLSLEAPINVRLGSITPNNQTFVLYINKYPNI